MEIKIDVPDYDKWEGVRVTWIDGHVIEVVIEDGEIQIWANREGLTSLAIQMLTIAQDAMPLGNHIHLTNVSGLDENSLDLLMGRR